MGVEEKTGLVRATSDDCGKFEVFDLICHADGSISLYSELTGFIAALSKGGYLIANRAKAGAWERFLLKDRSQKKPGGQARASPSMGPRDAPEADPELPREVALFDACCQLEAVLTAEETYAATRADKTAILFDKRARARRSKGLRLNFRHFCEQQRYPSRFHGCVSTWDATAIRIDDEQEACLGESADVADSSPSADSAALGDDRDPCRSWASILAEQHAAGEDGGGGPAPPLVAAAFGIPASSAAEADEAAFARLSALLRLPECVAVGPVGLDFVEVPEESPAEERFKGMSAAGIVAEFGCGSTSRYEAAQDPVCRAWVAAGARPEEWIMKHGDRRHRDFEAARADHERRRQAAQVAVAERQVTLAKDLGLPLIVQLPPQPEAERAMAEILDGRLGSAGCLHPVLLSAFQGRPKVAAVLLKHFPRLVVGFSGLATHGKLQDTLGEVVFDTPLDRLVLESLGPRWPPAAFGNERGSYSHPAHVAVVAEHLAKIKQASTNEQTNKQTNK